MKTGLLFLSLFTLMATFAPPAHALIKRPWAWTTIGHKGKLGCNFIGWYVFSGSSSSESCDLIVPLVKNNEEEIQHFVDVNHERLMEEMSQGQGTVLADYANLMGCSPEAVGQFSKATQSDFSNIFSAAPNANEVLDNTRKTMQQNEELRNKCKIQLS